MNTELYIETAILGSITNDLVRNIIADERGEMFNTVQLTVV